jgi:hypothetical protein
MAETLMGSRVVADALIGAFAEHYRCELPDDTEVLQRIVHPGGTVLENLVAAGAPPRQPGHHQPPPAGLSRHPSCPPSVTPTCPRANAEHAAVSALAVSA